MKSFEPKAVLDELKAHSGRLSEILSVSDFAEPDKAAHKLAKEYAQKDKGLKPTQLRQVFHRLKDVERKLKSYKDDQDIPAERRADILPMMPHLAYAFGRELIPPHFYELMKACLRPTMLVKVKDFRLLVEFLTAILAYHKYETEIKKKGGEQ